MSDRLRRTRRISNEVLADRLQGLLDGLVSRKQVHHAVVAVERGDRSFRWIGARGDAYSDGTPMRPDTPFNIASVTKLYIAVTVLQLHEQGRIGLDQSISAYLPASLIEGIHRLDGVDYTGSITIRHLLGHTSGLADSLEDRPKGGRSLIECLASEGDMEWSLADLFQRVREELTPHFPPQPFDVERPRIRYSDTNYQLLMAIIESVTAKPLYQIYEERLFWPLDLQHTYLPGHSEPLDPMPEPATIWFGEQPMDIPLAIRSFRDLVSTADDTLKFMRGLISGSIFDDPSTLSLMQQRWNRFPFPLDPAALRLPSWPIEYGLGLMRFKIPRAFTPIRPVPPVIGHTGSTGTWLFHCQQLDLLLSGTVDQATAGPIPFQFIPRLLRAFD